MDNHQIYDIIAKQLSGQASPEELTQWQQWMEASAANRQEYELLASAWERSGAVLEQPAYNTGAAWKKIDSVIRAKDKQSVPVLLLYMKRLAIAAALVAVFLISWFIFSNNDGSMQSQTASTSHQSIQLPDGSVVVLRKGSTLKYPERFNGKERTVLLTGEAFFQVQRDEQHPFLINTANSRVKVLGTSFLVNSHNETDEVVVQSGKVSVAVQHDEKSSVTLTAGQKLILEKEIVKQSTVTDSNYIAWKTDQLNFRSVPLPDVLTELEHYYSVPISTDASLEKTAQEIHVTAQFNHQPLEEVLDEIRLTTGLSVKKDGETVIFYKK